MEQKHRSPNIKQREIHGFYFIYLSIDYISTHDMDMHLNFLLTIYYHIILLWELLLLVLGSGVGLLALLTPRRDDVAHMTKLYTVISLTVLRLVWAPVRTVILPTDIIFLLLLVLLGLLLLPLLVAGGIEGVPGPLVGDPHVSYLVSTKEGLPVIPIKGISGDDVIHKISEDSSSLGISS
jgi:hypothetical protein